MLHHITSTSSFMAPISFFLGLVCFSAVQIDGLGVGINYGQIANNLPSPSRVSFLLRSLNITRVKLYDADPNVLSAFANSEVDFIIGIGNQYLKDMTDPANAKAWVVEHLRPHLPQTRISCIMVGNEVLPTDDQNLKSNLLPAMKTVHSALADLGLDAQVTVTTAHSLNILASSYPPSAGKFVEDLGDYLKPILAFHSQIKSPFLINAYPYFAYKASPDRVPIEYVLFQPNDGIVDPTSKLRYDNMLYAQIDAVYAAIEALGYDDVEVRISETGWPSKGDENEAGATPKNAGVYNGNLLRRIERREGTPAKPDVPLDIFVFALFNENLKPGPASERNYGLFYPDGSPVYDIGVRGYLPEMTFSSASTNVFSSASTNIFSMLRVVVLGIACLVCC